MSERFSKRELSAYVYREMRQINAVYGFDSDTGYIVVEQRDKKYNRAYGEYMALQNICDRFVLNPPEMQ